MLSVKSAWIFFKKNTHEISWLFPHLHFGNLEINPRAQNMPRRGKSELGSEGSWAERRLIDFTSLLLTLSQHLTQWFLFLKQIATPKLTNPGKPTQQSVIGSGLLQLLQLNDAVTRALPHCAGSEVSHPTQCAAPWSLQHWEFDSGWRDSILDAENAWGALHFHSLCYWKWRPTSVPPGRTIKMQTLALHPRATQ